MSDLIDDPFRAAKLILTLRREGITDPGVLRAVETVARSQFIEPDLFELAYEDCVLPIGCGQTLERPSVVAAMLQALKLTHVPDGKLLIVGAGSGYTAALAAQLCANIFAIDRFRRLADRAARNLETARIENVSVHHGDGLDGYIEEAPFDRILITGEIQTVPEVLLSQLYPDGLCVAPRVEDGKSGLVSWTRDGEQALVAPSVFHTPMQTGVSKAL